MLQEGIEGDVRPLVFFGQWMGIELMADELLLWSSEDIQCAFYVFAMEPEWLPYFLIGRDVERERFGLEPGEPVRLAVKVVPMSWLPAVDICQHLHRRAIQLQLPWGAGLCRQQEFRKDTRLPLNRYGRVRSRCQIYFDNYDAGRVTTQAY